MAGNAVGKFIKDVAGGFFGNDYLRDFKHASKTFRSNYYQNAPKFKFLFHVYFDINTNAWDNLKGDFANYGILVKSVKLPSYNFNTHELNQYNRKRIVQTKIKYDPIDITFHDDNDNFISSLWYQYYTYYYSDGTKPQVMFAGARGGRPNTEQVGGGADGVATAANYNSRTQYQPSITGQDDWGYIGETNVATPDQTKLPFFKNITVFGLSRHNFIAYTLVNPIITRFGHDTYSYDDGGVMTNTMTLDYETVVYNQGAIDGNTPENIVTGFGDRGTYDRNLSPISTPGSNSSILGPNGLVDGAGGAMKQLAGNNLLGAVKSAGALYNGFKNLNLKQTLKSEISAGIQNALQNSDNVTRSKLFDIPRYGQTPSNQGTAGAPPRAQASPPPVGTPNNAGVQNNVDPYRDGGG